MLDNLIFRCLALGLALLFAAAGLHKLGHQARFRGILADYRLLPISLVPLVGYLLPLLEIALGTGWLVLALRVEILPAVSWGSAMLLLIYALAIGVNLARGRRHIDCGCGLAAGPGHPLSPWQILRNLVLAALALLPLAGIRPREPVLMDQFVLVLALAALLLLYAALNQLLGNQGAINSWRKPHA